MDLLEFLREAWVRGYSWQHGWLGHLYYWKSHPRLKDSTKKIWLESFAWQLQTKESPIPSTCKLFIYSPGGVCESCEALRSFMSLMSLCALPPTLACFNQEETAAWHLRLHSQLPCHTQALLSPNARHFLNVFKISVKFYINSFLIVLYMNSYLDFIKEKVVSCVIDKR